MLSNSKSVTTKYFFLCFFYICKKTCKIVHCALWETTNMRSISLGFGHTQFCFRLICGKYVGIWVQVFFFRDFDIENFLVHPRITVLSPIVLYIEVSIGFWHSKCGILALLILFFSWQSHSAVGGRDGTTVFKTEKHFFHKTIISILL